MTPKTEWPVIAGEPASIANLYTGYILILAGVAALGYFLGLLTAGFGVLSFSAGFSLRMAIGAFVGSLIGVFLMALLIDVLAPAFGGQKNLVQALKTAAFAATASWVGMLGYIVPIVGTLIALAGAIYSIYLLYVGLPHTMRCPADKAGGYTAVTVIIAIVAGVLLSTLVGRFGGAPLIGGLGAGSAAVGAREVRIDPNSSLGKMEQWAEQVEQASKQLEQARKSGDPQATAAAAGAVLGAALGGGDAAVESLPPERLRDFLPESLGGLSRRSISVDRNAAFGFQVSTATASYRGDTPGAAIEIESVDSGGAGGLMALAGWAAIEMDRETDGRRERIYRDGARTIQEEWDPQNRSGRYSVILGQRFIATARGEDITLEQLKTALGSLNLDALESLKDFGRRTN
ncbi:MAG: YIP1 family protein [Steroidobacteraceae bacterium]|nr:YIP1 family protein [Steroidobacteraceae bacterium]MDW8257872.1 Yip1 family protein [Gammaproteobacteria bacterium]